GRASTLGRPRGRSSLLAWIAKLGIGAAEASPHRALRGQVLFDHLTANIDRFIDDLAANIHRFIDDLTANIEDLVDPFTAIAGANLVRVGQRAFFATNSATRLLQQGLGSVAEDSAQVQGERVARRGERSSGERNGSDCDGAHLLGHRKHYIAPVSCDWTTIALIKPQD